MSDQQWKVLCAIPVIPWGEGEVPELFLIEIAWNVKIATEKSWVPILNSMGVGVNIQRNIFTRNCMKFLDLHRKNHVSHLSTHGSGVEGKVIKKSVIRNHMKCADLQRRVMFISPHSHIGVEWGVWFPYRNLYARNWMKCSDLLRKKNHFPNLCPYWVKVWSQSRTISLC